jgi:NADPH:quinone reductase-like Zn-dependent oxidoreductase
MKAAVLHEFGQTPKYEEFPDPTLERGADEVIARVKAASLTNLAKGRASSSHYDNRLLPAVVGVDGIALLEDGTRVYCDGSRPPYGMMAERTVVPRSRCLPVPAEITDLNAAALPNPTLSSWLALSFRARIQPSETVLILGATGVAGRLAIQVAKHLGAGWVIAAGRNQQALEALPGLGADAIISLDQPDQTLAETFAREASNHHFDIILDYVWGHPAEVLINPLTGHDVNAEPLPVRFVSIGSTAGPTISLQSAPLRNSGLEIYGSGFGSVSHQAVVKTFPKMWELAAEGKLRIDTEPVPLAEISNAWQRVDLHGKRIVMLP